jgi:hypothetical protein
MTIHFRISSNLLLPAAFLLFAWQARSAAQYPPVVFQPLDQGTRISLHLPGLGDYSLDRVDETTLSLKAPFETENPSSYLVGNGYGLVESIEPVGLNPGSLTLIISLSEENPNPETTHRYEAPFLHIDILRESPGGSPAEAKAGGSSGLGLRYRGYTMQIRPRMSFFLPDGSVRVSLEEVIGGVRLITETYYDVVKGDMGYLLGYRVIPWPLKPGMDFFDSFEFRSIIAGENAWIRRKGARALVTHNLGPVQSSYRLSATRVSTDREDVDIAGLDNALGWRIEYDRLSLRPLPEGTSLSLQLNQSIPLLGGKRKYGRVHLVGTKAMPLGSRLVILEEFHLGHPLWRRIDLPYYAAFDLEGRDLLRGYRRTRVRSQLMTLLKSEVWIPLKRYTPRSYWHFNLEGVDLFCLLDLGYRTNLRSQIAQLDKYKGAWGGGLQLRASLGTLAPQSLRVFFAKGLARNRDPLFYLTVTY